MGKSQIVEYMKTLAKERGESAYQRSKLEAQLIVYYEFCDELADMLGIDVENESWWDVDEGRRMKQLKAACQNHSSQQTHGGSQVSPVHANPQERTSPC